MRQLEGVAHDPVAALAGEDRPAGRPAPPACPCRAGRRSPSTRPRCSRARSPCRCRAGPRPASGERTPLRSRTGRRLTYWWKPRRIGISSPHSETWSGTPGKPTAPRKIASNARSWSSPSSRHHAAGLRVASRSSSRTCVHCEVEAEAPAGRLQHAQALGHDFLADPVAGDDRDPVRHDVLPAGQNTPKYLRGRGLDVRMPPWRSRAGSRTRSSRAGSSYPPGYEHRDVAGVAVDGEDRVFLICRGDHPIIVYDQKGNFLRSWGEGDFTYRTHGITVAPRRHALLHGRRQSHRADGSRRMASC